MRAALLCLLAGALPAALADDPQVEIEFEPMSMDMMLGAPGAPPGLLGALSGARTGGRPVGGGIGHAQEDSLDRDIQGMLGSLLANGGPAGRGGEMVIEMGSPSAASGAMMGPIRPPGRSIMPVQMLRDLFPGPLLIDEGGGGATPFDAPDPLVMDMLQSVGHVFQDRMLPMLHSVTGRSRAPASCQEDLRAHCGTARSQVHCLGQHTGDISEACRQDVGRSVPFVCSGAIDRFCDVLRTGVLPCLGGHLEELNGACLDAVVATRDVITKAQTHKASVVDPNTGDKKGSAATPSAPSPAVAAAASPAQREASLDAALRGSPAPSPPAVPSMRAGLPPAAGTGFSGAPAGTASLASAAAAAKVATLLGAAPSVPQLSTWEVVRAALVVAVVAFAILLIANPDSVRTWRPLQQFAKASRQPLKGGVKHLSAELYNPLEV